MYLITLISLSIFYVIKLNKSLNGFLIFYVNKNQPNCWICYDSNKQLQQLVNNVKKTNKIPVELNYI